VKLGGYPDIFAFGATLIACCWAFNQCYQHQQRKNIAEGPKMKISATSGKISENIKKCRKNKKNTKIFIFFQIFKYLKQQQHHINAFPHKYEKRIDI
jgi:hypothetical protein